MTRTPLGRRLRSERIACKLTIVQLADFAQLSKSTISQIEGGTIRDITLSTCLRLAKALKCDPEFLAGWSL